MYVVGTIDTKYWNLYMSVSLAYPWKGRTFVGLGRGIIEWVIDLGIILPKRKLVNDVREIDLYNRQIPIVCEEMDLRDRGVHPRLAGSRVPGR
jgi:hypothetical protein